MKIDARLEAMIDRCARLWAAEAEVFRTYWDSPMRTPDTDRLWLLRQMYKELHDGVRGVMMKIKASFESEACDYDEMRANVLVMKDELAHYVGFASVYEALRQPGAPPTPGPTLLFKQGAWPENDRLMELRARHREDHGPLGLRAYRFTEGGYCTLFSEGMKLKGRGGIDGRIAEVCASVFEDEFDHMVAGVADIALSDTAVADADWRMLSSLVVDQLKLRVHMRNAQFSYPIAGDRLKVILAGGCAPLAFDYERAFGRGGPPGG